MRFFRSWLVRGWLVVGLLLMSLLAACGGGDGATAVITNPDPVSSGSSPRLTEDYADALPVQSQLAVGTLQLEETDMAVDEALAVAILPLWQALQSLSDSDTTAEAEITAVVNQIQSTMQPEQISAIAAMQLTQASMTTLIEAGTLVLGRGGGGADAADTTGGFVPSAGLPPGGGGLGGGQGGGIPGSGGGPGGGQTDMSEDDIATRQAARESGGFGGFQDRALTGAVVRLLQEKAGVELEQPADPFAAMWDVLTEVTGLTAEEIQTQTAEGVVLADLIEANGGDLTAVKAALIESLQDSPIAQRQDVTEYVTNLLAAAGE